MLVIKLFLGEASLLIFLFMSINLIVMNSNYKKNYLMMFMMYETSFLLIFLLFNNMLLKNCMVDLQFLLMIIMLMGVLDSTLMLLLIFKIYFNL